MQMLGALILCGAKSGLREQIKIMSEIFQNMSDII